MRSQGLTRRGACSACGKGMQVRVAQVSAPACLACRAARPGPEPRVCEWPPCSASYVPIFKAKGRPPQRWCSKACKVRAQNAARYPEGRDPERARTRALAKSRARRARLAAAAWDGVTDAAIMDRDGWVCQLCLEPVDPALRYPDLGSRSVDHIVALAAGGDDTAANKQAAHLGCNMAKGAA